MDSELPLSSGKMCTVQEVTFWLVITVLCLVAIQLVRLIFADGDLRLMRATWCGKKPGSLSGRVVWITGASSGLGEHLAYELARAGCRLVLTARRQNELDSVKRSCQVFGKLSDDDVLAFSLDMTDFESHSKAVQKVVERFNQIDILVNNAGRSQRGHVTETTLAVDQDIISLNVLGVLSLTKAVLPYMVSRKRGHLVVTSSIAGKIGAPFSAAYSATKFAVQGWFDAIRMEVAAHNIRVTTICPGPVVSCVIQNAFTHDLNKEIRNDLHTQEKKMSTSRCARLMAVAIANELDEVWIATHPVLFTTYLAQYAPDLTKRISTFIGQRATLLRKVREGDV